MHNRRPKRGLTLIEIFVGAMLFSLLLFALYSLFRVGRSFSHSASFSHMVSREFEAGVRQLRRDLRQTSLITMRSYPNPDTDDAPGLTLLSPYDENGRFQVSPHGTPRWNRHVHYTLVANGSGPTGSVVRWEEPLQGAGFAPALSGLLPSELATDQRRTVFRNILLPNRTVDGVPSGTMDTGEDGGFRVWFVDRQEGQPESLTSLNPAVSQSEGTTKLVHVQLRGLLSSRSTSKKSGFEVHFRAYCRY